MTGSMTLMKFSVLRIEGTAGITAITAAGWVLTEKHCRDAA
jgi:hypothetical protein